MWLIIWLKRESSLGHDGDVIWLLSTVGTSERLAGWTEWRWHFCPFSCPHNSLTVMKQGSTGIHTVSPYSRSQRVGRRQGKEGGKGCVYSDELYVNYSTSCCLSFPSLNLHHLCTLSLALIFLPVAPFLSVVVFPPGGLGKHGALDGLLCCLLRHLAHHPHRPWHAGPGKFLSINMCHSFQ